MNLEIRQALEPWHVLGEEGAAGGTARYVDSSLERLQVKVQRTDRFAPRDRLQRTRRPAAPDRHRRRIRRGRSLPRVATAANVCIPTIGVHAPLDFDIVDTWNNRSLGGCTYYVSHPGGLNYTTLPVNAYEAESRRLARFFKIGHTPGADDRARPQSAIRNFPSRSICATVDGVLRNEGQTNETA